MTYAENNPDVVATIVYHLNDNGAGDPWYQASGSAANTRANFYGVTGIPALLIDGLYDIWPINSANISSPVTERRNIPTPIEIFLAVEMEESTMDVTATVLNAGSAIESGHTIHFALTSNYAEWDASNEQDEFEHDLLAMRPNGNGQDFTCDAYTTAEYSATFNWPVDLLGEELGEDDVTLVVFVQDDETGEVLQARSSSLTPEGYPDYLFFGACEEFYHLGSTEVTATFDVGIFNLGLADDSYDIDVNAEDVPEGWGFSYSLPDGDHSDDATLSLVSDSHHDAVISLTPSATPGESFELTFLITSQNQPANFTEFTFFLQSSGEMLVVNSDPNGAYGNYFADAINAVNALGETDSDEQVTFGVWPNESYPLVFEELTSANPRLVMWYLGDFGVLTESEIAGLTAYVNNGGNLFLSGVDAPNYVAGTTLETLMGTYVGSAGDFYTIQGYDDDPIGDGIEVNLYGGDGANNYRNPVSVAGNAGTTCIKFGGTQLGAAVRNMSDNYRTLLFGFPFETIDTQEHRAALMLNIMVWMADFQYNGVIDGFGSDILPQEFALAQNHPNPFNPSTDIRFSLPEAAMVELTVFDMLGREVARLAEGQYAAGAHNIAWQADHLASGVYFYRLTALGDKVTHEATRKMILMK